MSGPTRLPRGPGREARPQLGQILHSTRKSSTKTARGADALQLRSGNWMALTSRFERNVFAVGFKLGEGDILLDGLRRIQRNQIHLPLFLIDPHNQEHPNSTSDLHSFACPGDVHSFRLVAKYYGNF